MEFHSDDGKSNTLGEHTVGPIKKKNGPMFPRSHTYMGT